MLGHGRQRLELDDHARRFQFRRAAQRALDDLFVVAPHLRHGAGVNAHGRQREVEFRIDRAAADDHAAAGGDGFGCEAEDQFSRIRDGQGMVMHGSLIRPKPPARRACLASGGNDGPRECKFLIHNMEKVALLSRLGLVIRYVCFVFPCSGWCAPGKGNRCEIAHDKSAPARLDSAQRAINWRCIMKESAARLTSVRTERA